MTASQPRAPRHLDALTGIRGIAAWAVVLYHARLSLTAILPGEVIAVLARGYLAVDLFFMLSGFVIWYNYADRIAAGGARATGPFLWRRFARIWPLHAALLAAFIVLKIALEGTGRHLADTPWEQLPLQVLLIQNWGFTSALAWNHPAWSISTEAGAYLAFPAMVALGMRLRGRWAIAAAMIALLVAERAMFAAAGQDRLGDDICGLGLGRCLFEFALGTLACRLWQSTGGHAAPAWPFALAGAAWLALGLASGWSEVNVVPPALLCALLALARDTGAVSRLLARPLAVWLGEVSYATYLVHVLVFIVFKLVFVGPDLQLGRAGLAGYLALVLAASAVLYRGLERPAQAWLNAAAPRWAGSARRAAVPQARAGTDLAPDPGA